MTSRVSRSSAFTKRPALIWAILTGIGTLYFTLSLTGQAGNRQQFLPGKTTHGHHQIELSCDSCHTSNFTSSEELQAACLSCHQQELTRANDSHPKSKFTDPRNADRLSALDARLCVTCHSEHRPELTASMGLSLPEDYCYHCHQDIEKERPSHAGMPFDSCDDAGCHNYHDNGALYEDYLAKHMAEPAHLESSRLPARHSTRSTAVALTRAEANGPENGSPHDEPWSLSAHARAGVNCTGCHQPAEQAAWTDRVDFDTCQSCHAQEAAGWLQGKHGMRLAAGLSPLTVADARSPMTSQASHATLTCNSCHDPHSSDTRHAASEACMGCHNDTHTQAYKKSKHFTLWKQEAFDTQAANGASCATCHLPRLIHPETQKTYVEHNQNSNLRPNEKMIRTVCINCHGIGFSIDALADPKLILNNFSSSPTSHVLSIDMVKQRAKPGTQ